MRLLFLLLWLSACSAESAPAENIYWSDGDSGVIDGEKFRLIGIDAPETGPIGPRSGAKCERERTLGYEAKAFMVNATKGKSVVISQTHGADRYGRLLVDLSVEGKDVARLGRDAGHLKAWRRKANGKLGPKPDWCD